MPASHGPDARSAERIARARQRLEEGALEEALVLCAELLDAGIETAELHLLLAEIYQAQGRSEFAARARRRAAALSPRARASPERPAAAEAEELPEHSPWRIAAIAVGAGLAGAGLLLAWYSPGPPAIGGLPWAYVGVGGIGGWGLAVALAAAGALGSFDDELAFGSLKGPGRTVVPNGVLLLVTGVMSPYVALAAFAIVSISESRLYRGILVAFAATFGWAAVLCLLGLEQGLPVAPIIGWGVVNLVFVAVLVGWGFGHMFRARPWD